ncbi:TRAP transporter large permease [Chloroflexota bacterium]
MAPPLIGLAWFIATFIFIIVLKVPLGVALGLCGFFGLITIYSLDTAVASVGFIAAESIVNYMISAVPLFILMGVFASEGGLSTDAFYGIRKWVGRLPGGLAVTTVGACGAFAAVSGSSLATASSLGVISYREMRKYDYSPRLAAGSIAAGGTLGGMIPPSIPLILIAMITEQSAGKILIAGFIPGLLEIVVYCTIIIIMSTLNPSYGPRAEPSSLREKMEGLTKLWPIVVLFLIVMGGIYFGIFTPTEGAAVGAFAAAVMAIARKKINRRNIRGIMENTTLTAASLLVVLVGATLFNMLLDASQLPMFLSQWISGLDAPTWGILLLIVALYLFLGATMDTLAMLFLTIPITYPIMVGTLGLNGIWYAIIIERLVEIANITPPIGMTVFAFHAAVRSYENISIAEVFKGIVPFFIGDLICLAILMSFPGFVLWLPNLMG